jgi:hypothetical protein
MALGACIKTLIFRELVLTEYVTNGSIEADVKVLITGVDPYGGVGRLSHILGYELKGRSLLPGHSHGHSWKEGNLPRRRGRSTRVYL